MSGNVANEISELSRRYLDRFDELSIVIEDPETGYHVRSEMLEYAPVIVTKCRADGLTAEHIAPIVENPACIVTKMNNKMTVDRLPNDD